jgi:hypothetical protein
MRVYISGSWREIESGLVRVGGAWKNLVRIRAYVGGAWEDVASFIQPLTLSASPVSPNAFIFGSGTATTDAVTVTPSGGAGPFTYSWSLVSGTCTIISPTSASTTFSRTLTSGERAEVTVRCTVTDSLGTIATIDIVVTFESFSFS